MSLFDTAQYIYRSVAKRYDKWPVRNCPKKSERERKKEVKSEKKIRSLSTKLEVSCGLLHL